MNLQHVLCREGQMLIPEEILLGTEAQIHARLRREALRTPETLEPTVAIVLLVEL